MKSVHGNSHQNEDEHHLYRIIDKDENAIFKYGISGKPLNSDGSSPRANELVSFLNKALGLIRFIGEVILTGIKGRKKAEEIEKEYISRYLEENGHLPPGNE